MVYASKCNVASIFYLLADSESMIYLLVQANNLWCVHANVWSWCLLPCSVSVIYIFVVCMMHSPDSRPVTFT